MLCYGIQLRDGACRWPGIPGAIYAVTGKAAGYADGSVRVGFKPGREQAPTELLLSRPEGDDEPPDDEPDVAPPAVTVVIREPTGLEQMVWQRPQRLTVACGSVMTWLLPGKTQWTN